LRKSKFTIVLSVLLLASSVVMTKTPANAVVCNSAAGRVWKLINKSPDNYKGKNFWVFGNITQFDAATGTSQFRADASGDNKLNGKYFFGGDNSYFFGNPKVLKNFVNGDVFKACVTVKGAYTYDLAHGGSLTVPSLQIQSMTLIGSTS